MYDWTVMHMLTEDKYANFTAASDAKIGDPEGTSTIFLTCVPVSSKADSELKDRINSGLTSFLKKLDNCDPKNVAWEVEGSELKRDIQTFIVTKKAVSSASGWDVVGKFKCLKTELWIHALLFERKSGAMPCVNGEPIYMTEQDYGCICPLGYVGNQCDEKVKAVTELPTLILDAYRVPGMFDLRDDIKKVGEIPI